MSVSWMMTAELQGPGRLIWGKNESLGIRARTDSLHCIRALQDRLV